jgi:hypothetical protein
MKYLVALQYWEGDRDAAHRLMQFLPEITPENNQYADFVVIHRFDSTKPDDEVLKNLNKSFNKVYVIKGKEQLIGYPNGSNGLWSNLVEIAYRKHTETATSKPPEWSEYKAVLGIEADCCPISLDWLEKINHKWDESNVMFMGHHLPFNCDHPNVGHINGNAMFVIDLFKKVPGITGTPHGVAWDTYHAKKLRDAGWKSIPEIVSIWNTRTINETGVDALVLNKCVLVHGVKDNSVIQIMKRRTKDETNRITA